MAFKPMIRDTDPYYLIDVDTRTITRENGGTEELVQYDNDSERITFKVANNIEGHPVQTCDRIEIHYMNISRGTSASVREINEDFYVVDDARTDTNDPEMTIFTWLVSQNATQLVGTIIFQIHFISYPNDSWIPEEEQTEMVWSTKIYSALNVSEGLNCTKLVLEKNPDVIRNFEERISRLERRLTRQGGTVFFEDEPVAPAYHGEGAYSVTLNKVSDNYAGGDYAVATGTNTVADGIASMSEGKDTTVNGDYSHGEGQGTIASGEIQHVQGKFNIEDTENKYADIIGNGVDDDNRSNAATVDWDGNAWFAGNATIGPNNEVLATEKYVDDRTNIVNYSCINLFDNDFDEAGYISSGEDVNNPNSDPMFKRTSFRAFEEPPNILHIRITDPQASFSVVLYDSEKNHVHTISCSNRASIDYDVAKYFDESVAYFRISTYSQFSGKVLITVQDFDEPVTEAELLELIEGVTTITPIGEVIETLTDEMSTVIKEFETLDGNVISDIEQIQNEVSGVNSVLTITSNKVLKIAGDEEGNIPPDYLKNVIVTEEDNGKVLQVVDGEWSAQTIEVTSDEEYATETYVDEKTTFVKNEHVTINLFDNVFDDTTGYISNGVDKDNPASGTQFKRTSYRAFDKAPGILQIRITDPQASFSVVLYDSEKNHVHTISCANKTAVEYDVGKYFGETVAYFRISTYAKFSGKVLITTEIFEEPENNEALLELIDGVYIQTYTNEAFKSLADDIQLLKDRPNFEEVDRTNRILAVKEYAESQEVSRDYVKTYHVNSNELYTASEYEGKIYTTIDAALKQWKTDDYPKAVVYIANGEYTADNDNYCGKGYENVGTYRPVIFVDTSTRTVISRDSNNDIILDGNGNATYTYENTPKTISFIGESREGVIIRTKLGEYVNAPVLIRHGNVELKNMTIIADHSDNSDFNYPTKDGGVRRAQAYALHIDGGNNDSFGENSARVLVENVTAISYQSPAFGMGTIPNSTIRLENCKAISFTESEENIYNAGYANQFGAVLCHKSVAKNGTATTAPVYTNRLTEKLELVNVEMYSKNNNNVLYLLDDNANKEVYELLAINTVIASGITVDGAGYVKDATGDNIVLDESSSDNTCEVLNNR